jgi:hypothetical protein
MLELIAEPNSTDGEKKKNKIIDGYTVFIRLIINNIFDQCSIPQLRSEED